MEETLRKVAEFADRAHGDQMRKYTPARYIVHPLRVMETVREYSQDTAVLAAAILHDVLEDTSTKKKEMREFLYTVMDASTTDRTVEIVKELTDEYTKKNYPNWNRKKRKQKEHERLSKTSAEAQTIKYADLMDNSAEIAKEDPDFADRYLNESEDLLKRMDKGNPQLRARVIEQVERLLKETSNY